MISFLYSHSEVTISWCWMHYYNGTEEDLSSIDITTALNFSISEITYNIVTLQNSNEQSLFLSYPPKYLPLLTVVLFLTTSCKSHVIEALLFLQHNVKFNINLLLTVYSPGELTKYSVVNEFQCFFVFRQGESKSLLITCRCTWLEMKHHKMKHQHSA